MYNYKSTIIKSSIKYVKKTFVFVIYIYLLSEFKIY